MSRYVEGVVAEWLRGQRRLPLDYSVESLRVADRIVAGLRAGQGPGRGADERAVARALRGVGAYVGEVMVRAGGGSWVDLDDRQRDYFEQPVGVRMPDGRVWNPLGRALRRYDRGKGGKESLYVFYLLLHGRLGGLSVRRP
ncbi:hypothetical protein O7599_14665 [Streptomyces sp. WMMC500]|uniref:hypothetical protein n=1 Tax=Streptomyces sp. WMMC500 TaxID=3015154 RepID=UPI00248AD02A|nr:hypothetical protein [Streptomyces sp. WMMC500]WBB64501.1 hypothetical protein O7599_14665 [Streptomyces sp. WMMC500]